jgi:hypothetical protein
VLKLNAPQTPGLDVKLDRDKVPENETARVLFRYKPQRKILQPQKVTVNVEVEPTNQTIPIQVTFDPPPAKK